MSEWKKVKIGDVCRIEKGSTGIASAEPGQYPLVVTAAERKTCSSFQFDCSAVCIPLVSSTGHGKKSLNYVHYQEGKFALGTILAAVIPNDENELSAKYLHQYLQFYKDTTLVPLMKGAANVSLAVRDIAKVEIPLPTIEKQREFAELFVTLQKKDKEIQKEFSKQKSYAKQLRQSILQDAIEGKLTADWRKYHPVEKGNPDYDAEALFQKIQEEKEKQATLAEGKRDEKFQIPLFEEALKIPSEWKIKKFGEISKQITDGTHQTPNYVEHGEIFLSAQNVKPFKFLPENHKFVSKSDFETYRKNRTPEKNDLLISRVGAVGECAVINIDLDFAFYVSVALVKLFPALTIPDYLAMVMNSRYGVSYAKRNASSTGTSAGNFNLGRMRSFPIPLPPLAEQTEIVRRVETQLDKITQLEQQITTREELTKQLMRNILRNAFEGERRIY